MLHAWLQFTCLQNSVFIHVRAMAHGSQGVHLIDCSPLPATAFITWHISSSTAWLDWCIARCRCFILTWIQNTHSCAHLDSKYFILILDLPCALARVCQSDAHDHHWHELYVRVFFFALYVCPVWFVCIICAGIFFLKLLMFCSTFSPLGCEIRVAYNITVDFAARWD